MTAYDSVGSHRPQRNPGTSWGLAGLIVGIAIGLIMPRIWNRLKGTPSKPQTTAAQPRPNPVETLQITAQPAQQGLLLSAPVPLKMLKTSETKRAKQQDRAVFTGFRNWGVTTNYLTSGSGDLLLKASDGTTTKWTQADYKALLQKKPLTAKIVDGKTYTLFFQRKGRRTVDLGTFSTANTNAEEAGLDEGPSEATDEADVIVENAAEEDTEAENGADDPDAELHDTSELDAGDAPIEDAPAEDKAPID